MVDSIVYPGQSLKYVGTEGDALRAEGYLVLFTDDDSPDLEGEYFTKSTDLGPVSDGIETVLPAYFHHGMDDVVGKMRSGFARVKMDDVGIWASYWITRHKEYLKELLEAGVLGQSSGPAQHLIEKAEGKKSVWIKSWPLAEASLTPEPAESRTIRHTVPLKSLLAPGDIEMGLKSFAEELRLSRLLREQRGSLFNNATRLGA